MMRLETDDCRREFFIGYLGSVVDVLKMCATTLPAEDLRRYMVFSYALELLTIIRQDGQVDRPLVVSF